MGSLAAGSRGSQMVLGGPWTPYNCLVDNLGSWGALPLVVVGPLMDVHKES